MSFRIEEKINIRKENLYKFYEWLNSHSGHKIYPNRKIFSIYFDNQNLNMYHDSIEGIIPRKKIRIRTYNDLSFKKNNVNLEKKKRLVFQGPPITFSFFAKNFNLQL